MHRWLLIIAAAFFGTSSALAAPPAPTVSVVSVSVDEGQPAEVQIQRAGNLSRPSTIIYATADATALAEVNYTARSGGLTFAKGQSLATVTIPTIRDGLVRGNLYFLVRLGVSSNATVLQNGTVTVRDLDIAAPPPPPVQCPDGTTVPAGQTCPEPPPPPPPTDSTVASPGDIVVALSACVGSYIPDALVPGQRYIVLGNGAGYRPEPGRDPTVASGYQLNPEIDDGVHRGDGWFGLWVPFDCVAKVAA